MHPLDKVVVRDGSTGAWQVFRDPVRVLTARRVDEVVALLDDVDDAVATQGLAAAGFLCYEAAPAFDDALRVKPGCTLPLACFGLYDGVETLKALPEPADNQRLDGSWELETEAADYATRVAKIKAQIELGNCYQVNYTLRQSSASARDPWDLFLCLANDARYAAFVELEDHAILSCSPELFFALHGERIETRPMKGTSRRGLTSSLDNAARAELEASTKNRAENIMITDMLRNDLGKIALSGSVRASRLLDIEKHPTVWQMTSTVEATTRARLPQLMQALFPSASITGAPKASTMSIIADLEDSPREIYTGSIGYWLPDRTAQFNVAIRTLWIDKRTRIARYGTGGGIVWDSCVDEEYDECRAKTDVLKTRSRRDDFSLLETLLWTAADGYFLLDDHLARLRDSADYFGRRCDIGDIRRALADFAAGLEGKRQRVRLLVDPHGEVTLEHAVLDGGPRREPVRLRLARRPVDADDPFLYHKTTRRDVYEDALTDAADCDDVILYNADGFVTETCVANVVIEQQGRKTTPPVHCGLLGGVYRARLLRNGDLTERPVHVSQLSPGQRITLINSVRGEYPAVLVNGDVH